MISGKLSEVISLAATCFCLFTSVLPQTRGQVRHFVQPVLVDAVSSHHNIVISRSNRQAITKIFSKLDAISDLHSRILLASESLLGANYQRDPLGEGRLPDKDPRILLNKFDCQTYIETVIALALSRNCEELLLTLDDIRYDGDVSYSNRNHFFEAQWVPTNFRKGYLLDITGLIAPQDVKVYTKSITKSQWKHRIFARRIQLPTNRLPVGEHTLSYLPLSKVLSYASQIPSGAVFAVVRKDMPLAPTMIRHVGYVVHKNKRIFVRHARKSGVGDEEIAHFVARISRLRWPILGLQFWEVQERHSVVFR